MPSLLLMVLSEIMSNISILRLISSVSFRRSINSRVWSPCTCVQNFAHLMEAAQTKLVSVKSNNSTVLPQLNDKLISHKKSVYTLTYLIGEGGYGTVFQCTDGNNKFDFIILILSLCNIYALVNMRLKWKSGIRPCWRLSCTYWPHLQRRIASIFVR